MKGNKIILYEYQKKRVCEFYGCSDEQGNQYPICVDTRPEICQLYHIYRLIDELNEPLKDDE